MTETIYHGVALSPGCTVARVCLFNEKRHSNLPIYRVSEDGKEREVQRTSKAMATAIARLDEIRERIQKDVGQAEAEIFVAQKMILEDSSTQNHIFDLIHKENINAETAVARVLDTYESRILALDNEYIRERASDLGEVKRRVLDVLSNMQPSVQCDEAHCQRGKNRIIVAEELTPSMTIDLDSHHTMGFVTERGGRLSHAAILARAIGIPAVSGIPDIRNTLSCGTEILVDGNTGQVVIWPSEKTVAEVHAQSNRQLRLPSPVPPVPGFTVMANINTPAEALEARDMLAEGIGLYRTEIEVMAAGHMLTEDEFYERYAATMATMAGKAVTFRLFDFGSDKPLPSVKLPREDNPALGWRGARLLQGRKDLVSLQARALARASQHGPLHVLYPMIVDLPQFLGLKKMFLDAVEKIPHGEIFHGVMLEVPSACLQAEEILEAADFASIGTNDLIQYLFAVDRDNENVAQPDDPDHPALWVLIRTMAEAARKKGKPLSVCGEIGSDPAYVAKLVSAGINIVSSSVRGIAGVRQALEQTK